jgi:CspA family cold shock protein
MAKTIKKDMSGTVKFFNTGAGWGFIIPADGGPDVYVHEMAANRAELGSLSRGDKISFDLVEKHGGKLEADNLRRLAQEGR